MGVIQLLVRDAVDDIKSAPSTFSSWDKCMQKTYCKWPAIIAIVVGSVIVLSVLFCLVRCLCCGVSCCCSCLSCFNDCCPSGGRRKRSRYAEGLSNFTPNPYQGYQPTPSAPPQYEPPRFAQFDASGKNGKPNEDSLPAMPSWDKAPTKQIETATPHNDMEMGNMNRRSGQGIHPASAGGPGGRGRYSQVASNPSPVFAENVNPYESAHQMHPYGGDIGSQQARPDYYSRPAPTLQGSYGSPQHGSYSPHYTSPTSQQPPQGGFRAPPSADQFQPSAMAPTPSQYNIGYNPQLQQPQQPQPQSQFQHQQNQPYAYSEQSAPSSTRYEPSHQYGQETGITQRSPTSGPDSRPPSILQAGRKPVAGSWRDV